MGDRVCYKGTVKCMERRGHEREGMDSEMEHFEV